MLPDLIFSSSAHYADRPALIDHDGQLLSYAELAARAGSATPAGSTRSLIFFCVGNKSNAVAILLALLREGHVVALLNPGLTPEQHANVIERYDPDWLVLPELTGTPINAGCLQASHMGHCWLRRRQPQPAGLHTELALLLSTSGTTGSPKFVRLSIANLRANADAISHALDIDAEDRAAGHLPLHYSYGLSVLTSHLARGASLVFISEIFTSGGFWASIRDQRCTSLPGVPYHYEMLRRLDLDKLNVPSIATCTQAGGRLAPKLVTIFAEQLAARGGRFFVMYGQTEAAPRMTTLPAHETLRKPTSVGRALSGGWIEIRRHDGSPAATGEAGEIVYHGPNVMLGYAESRADLARGDDNQGVLHTGDVGYLDEEGDLYITGRTSRIAKVLGLRIDLDDVERALGCRGAAVEARGKLILALEGVDPESCQAITETLALQLQLHASVFDVRCVDSLPLKPSGKIDYRRIAESFE